MRDDSTAYNYENFSFSLEDGAFERWLAESPALGQQAPDFELAALDGQQLRLNSLRGRPVVLEFGSYTCPIFCAQIPPMNALALQHDEASFLVIYTREAHPGEITPAHRSDTDKVAAASLLAQEEQLGRTVLVDDVEGTVHAAYGQAWDAVFVLDAEGRVVLRRAWNDPEQVGAVLSAIAAGEPPDTFESVDMTRVVGHGGFGHGLLRGGERALLDFYESAPPPVRERLKTSESADVRRILEEA